MIPNIRVGIPIIGGTWWMGGVSYIELLVRAVSSLKKEVRPDLYLIVYDHNLKDLSLHETLVPLVSGIIYIGENYSEMKKYISHDVIHFRSHNKLFTFIDFYFPVNTDLLPRKNAGTWIPDFQHFYLPEFFSQSDLEWRHSRFQKLAEQSHLIIFSSEDARSDFRKFFPNSKATTEVLHFYAMPQDSWYESDPKEVREKYGIPERFIICSNQFWVHKNHKKLFEAFSKIDQTETEIALVCTGSTEDYRSAEYYQELQEYIQKLGLSSVVYLLGMIPRDEQIQLMRGSLFVVQPSLFEGWSTVVEDSRALGKDILLSDLIVNIEQAPEHGVFFKRNDSNDLAEKMEKLIRRTEPGPNASKEAEARTKAKENVLLYAKKFCNIVNISLEAKSKYYEAWLKESDEVIETQEETIYHLESKLKESELDRQARLEVINDLQKHLAESELDRQARLEVINDLQKHLAESELDRQARLGVINQLKSQLLDSEADREATEKLLTELSDKLKEYEINTANKLWLLKRIIKI
ncbi:glycosyltransferase family 4 protein [Cohnella terricola]|nr:glycosyltransferase family 1 protein [Cohnella terricola]